MRSLLREWQDTHVIRKERGVRSLEKEAVAMRVGHLLKRASREFLRNLLWMLLVFGPVALILVPAANLSLLGVLAFVIFSVSVLAAIFTGVVLWSDAHDETALSTLNSPMLPGDGSGGHGTGLGGWDGGGGGGDGGGGG
jgi:uncharacterized membrane protein YgcG